MKIYLALIAALGLGIAIVAASIIFVSWASVKYKIGSFEHRTTRIVILWLDFLIALVASYSFINIMLEEIHAHQAATTAFLLVGICIITDLSYKARAYVPVVCTGIVFPFTMYGIWGHTGWAAVGWSILSAIYALIAVIAINDALDTPTDNSTIPTPPSATQILGDIIEQGAHDIGAT